jgi:hypothetical protein
MEEPKRLTVPFRIRHSEVALEALRRGATTLVPDDHDGNLSETGRSAYDGWIVSEESITVKLYEVAKYEFDIIERERSVEVSRQLYSLVRRELAVDILADLGNLAL